MKALVTGGAGFIGSHLVDLLIKEGHETVVVDNLVTGKLSNLNPRARFYEVDICAPRFRSVLDIERPEVVFHQAAQMSVKVSTDDPRYDAQVNVMGLINVLEACVAAGVRKIVFASSGATYGNPDYLPMDEVHPQRPEAPYGITKLIAEHYLSYYARDHGLRYTALRYGNVYGPRQDSRGEAGVIAIFTNQLLRGQVPTIHWDGEQVRDYVYVEDVARANLAAATAGDDRIYCIGTGQGSTVNQIFSAVSRCLDVDVTPRQAPRRAGDLRAAYFTTTRALNELNWQAAIPLNEGIDRTVASFKAELELSMEAVGA